MSDRARKRLQRIHGRQNVSSIDAGGLRRIFIDGYWGLCWPKGQIILSSQCQKLYPFDPLTETWSGIRNGRVVKFHWYQTNTIIETEDKRELLLL